MKRFCLLFFSCMLVAKFVLAQLPDGSTAPDFTFTDINGNTQNLYSYLNQGKYVAIDVSATWCVPCWSYHNQGTMDSIYQLHDIPGAGDWKVMLIEADASTDSADLNGTGTNTQGNWVQGAGYTIIDPIGGMPLTNFKNGYVISVFPTFYMICPNKKVYQDTFYKILAPYVNTWEYAASTLCTAAGIDNMADKDPLTIYPNPAVDKTTLYFGLNKTAHVVLSLEDMLGREMIHSDYGPLYPGDQKIALNTEQLSQGIYTLRLSVNTGRTVTKKLLVR